MSDDEADPELVALLRAHLGLGPKDANAPAETKVLDHAHFIYNNSIDVALDMKGCQTAAASIWKQMREREYSTSTWSEHELHPKTKDEATVNFIFTMDLLNFSFWSAKGPGDCFSIVYKGRKWTGYWSLVAALQRALDGDIPITDPSFWADEEACTEDVLRTVFSSATEEEIPLFNERLQCLREAGKVLEEQFDGSIATLISDAQNSAAKLVNLLADHFACFRDQAKFEGKTVRLLKRAQILVADLWAAFDGESYGEFHDIDTITMFADYRVPQMLYTLGCISYSPPLEARIRHKEEIEPGHSWEIQLRGCSIWCVEQIRREIVRCHPEAKVNAILLDFFLYDTMKELEEAGKEQVPHHRTRSIWY
ncbi:putative cobyrinic acid-diamide synthase [Diplodia corticola]|uniref:Queuosine 5'-phosphate N-glycosylase/hydrolase n=1 Tax=Diplodia corticola TaxID=236234 RepID=A0A1J9RB69_9PEZI|nr:putative cobyrinic acid-diamide synthase [Diplodia corticola]OJD37800.1 putative cobyrinic acid-diamide synthase [Diplodia corticola]